MREDALDHRGLEDRRDDLELSAAVGAVLEVDLEDPLEQPGPADARRPAVCAAGLSGVELRRVGILVGTCRHQGYYGELVWILTMMELWLRAHAGSRRLVG